MELVELATALKHVLRGAGRMRGRDTHLLGSEVGHAQFELLNELYERGPMSAGELAVAAELTPATVTQMLDHLANCGHVERTRQAADRRVVVSGLTAGGQKRSKTSGRSGTSTGARYWPTLTPRNFESLPVYWDK